MTVTGLEAFPGDLHALVAERFKCRKSAVTIQSGAAGRIKRVRVETP